MKKLSIAFFVTTFPNLTETFILNQIIYLLDRGHDVRIFAFQKGQNQVTHSVISTYDLMERATFFEIPRSSRRNRAISFLKFILSNYSRLNLYRLRKIFNFIKDGKEAFNLSKFHNHQWVLQKGPFDLIHAHYGHNGAYISELRFYGYFKNTPLVTTFHGYDIVPADLSENRIRYKKLFKEADLLTGNSPYLISIIKNLTSARNIQQLAMGIDTNFFNNKHTRNSGSFTILFVGRLIKLKGPHLVLKVANLLHLRGHKNFKVVLIGDGDMYEELKNLSAKLNLQGFVVLKRSISQQEVRKEMEESDILLFPGLYDKDGRAETQGLVIQEAQAMKLPVIVSDAGGSKYGMIDNETGYVVHEKDIKGFADKVEYLMKNPLIRRKMGERGREFICKYYDSKIVGEKLERFYYNLVKQ